MQRTMITGVAGMVGSHLAESLVKQGHEVIGIDNLSYGSMDNLAPLKDKDSFKLYTTDIRDLSTMKILGRDVDTIVHLAAVKKVGNEQSAMDTLKVNTTGTENVLDVARLWDARCVFASTSDVYGMSDDLPFREDGDLLLGPSMIRRWSYAVSKLYGEQVTYAYHQDYDLETVILRYFGAFSERAAYRWSGGHIPLFIEAVLEDRPVPIHGDGSQTRSMCHVEDLVRGTEATIETEGAIGEIINIGGDEELSVLETAKLIHRLADTGRELKLEFTPFEKMFGKGYKDIMRRMPDLSKAERLLGYRPRVSLEEAIRRTLAAIKVESTK